MKARVIGSRDAAAPVCSYGCTCADRFRCGPPIKRANRRHLLSSVLWVREDFELCLRNLLVAVIVIELITLSFCEN